MIGIGWIKSALEAWGLVRKTADELRGIKGLLASPARRFASVDELSQAFFSSEIREGERILVEGITSRYSHYYQPRAFSPFLPGTSQWPHPPEKETSIRFWVAEPFGTNVDIPKGLSIEYSSVLHTKHAERALTQLRIPYLPATALPPLQDPQGPRQVFFLYPPNSKGLVALPPMNRTGAYTVPPGCRGVPMIATAASDIAEFSESTCQIDAVIRKAPEHILSLLSDTPLQLRRELSSNFYRPESPTSKGYFLELISAKSALSPSLDATSFMSTLFVEAHVDGLRFESIRDLLQPFMLERFELLRDEISQGFSPGLMKWGGDVSLSLERANIVARAPNYIGFYVTCDIRTNFESSYLYPSGRIQQLHSRDQGVIRRV